MLSNQKLSPSVYSDEKLQAGIGPECESNEEARWAANLAERILALETGDRIVLEQITWPTYKILIGDLESQPALRVTYDRGCLEIKMPLDPHESYKKLLGRLVEALTEELGIEIRSLGSRTCDREDLARGLEPDQCYYIQNEPLVWNKTQIDLKQDPPPDLAIEIDITSPSLNRLDIYAELGVPEVWRFDGQSLTMYRLEQGQYSLCRQSQAFRFLSPADLEQFLALRQTVKENALVRQFRQWVGQQLDT